ncbi:hypothetical protein RHGRI_022744 [Rhododendron griersonianum]|uniref:BZIP domain-containing protein n=1 Tax=Rhododendron griersonianum TaxID=479676 RepID=A0AAV6J366_9ERIC|nr:hypothetical protein RHGRI_022744 [Rhododendron griersonianum]
MASPSLLNLLSFSPTATPLSKPPPPPPPHKSHFLRLPLSSSFPPLRNRNQGCKSLLSSSEPFSSTEPFSSCESFNVEVEIDEDDNEDRLIEEFRREVIRAGVIQECVRRKFHENKHEKKKRKNREAARRNRKRRTPYRDPALDEAEAARNREEEDRDDDNWDF